MHYGSIRLAGTRRGDRRRRRAPKRLKPRGTVRLGDDVLGGAADHLPGLADKAQPIPDIARPVVRSSPSVSLENAEFPGQLTAATVATQGQTPASGRLSRLG